MEGDVRLVNGSDLTEGRPEVCIGEEWRTICDQGWSLNDANILCGQLGFAAGGKSIECFFLYVYLSHYNYYNS